MQTTTSGQIRVPKTTTRVSTNAATEPASLKRGPAGLGEPATRVSKLTPIDEITIKPVNWFILIRERVVDRITEGGVIRPDQAMHAEEMLSYYGEVVALGPNCFQHAKFSGAGAQCKVGDWVVIGRYAGQKMQLRGSGETYRMITDDMIMGVTTEPEDLVVYAG